MPEVAVSKITFSRPKNGLEGEWNLRGPAAELVPGAVVSVGKRDGTTVNKVVGQVLETFPLSGSGEVYAVARVHPTLTVAAARKAAKKAAKAAARPVLTDEQKAILRGIAAAEGEDAAAKHYRGWFSGASKKDAAEATLDILAADRKGGDRW